MTQTTQTRPSYRPFAVEVRAVERISPSFRRLTLAGPDLGDCAETLLDQRIKMVLGSDAQISRLAGSIDWQADWSELRRTARPVMRTYTLAGVDRRAGLVDVDVACYPVHGPVSQFARQATQGDRLLLIGPDARSEFRAVDGVAWRPDRCSDVLVVGDETALPAIRNILRSLRPHMSGLVVVEVPHRADADDLFTHARGVRVEVVERRSARVGDAATDVVRQWTEGRSFALPRQLRSDAVEELLWDEAFGDCSGMYAWLAGEAGWLAGLRRELLASGVVQRKQASFMGYWRRGAVLD